jgi:cytochrome oxidase Cu insertion factor (SCO1/SenC/PrrC family)
MRFVAALGLACVLLVTAVPETASAQKEKKTEEEFVKEKPSIGDLLPAVTVFTPAGTVFDTSDLRGHYTVLTFGCLT